MLSNPPTFQDIPIPSRCLIKHNDIEGITQNPVFEVIFDHATLNRDFLRIITGAWITASEYTLVEFLGPVSFNNDPKSEITV
jgi:hypothetical protein